MDKKGRSFLTISLIIIIISIGVYFFMNGIPQIIQETNETITNLAGNLLPNSSLSPGDILTNNLTIICVSGYSATVRDVSQSLREEVFARDNVPYPQPTGTTELDHIIPLCLGGSNSEDNLFVEFAEPKPGYKEKDKLENYLCDHVCNGEIDIDYAQKRIAHDWYSYYLEIY